MTEKALSDVTILDFSHLLQGPFCTQLLADLLQAWLQPRLRSASA